MFSLRAKPRQGLEAFVGCLPPPPKALSVEEINAVIAFEGELLGGTEFLSFDQQAVKLLKGQKRKVRLLGS